MWEDNISEDELDLIAAYYFDLHRRIEDIASLTGRGSNRICHEVVKMQMVPPPNDKETQAEIEAKIAMLREDMKRFRRK